jgi:hypothetical protein
MTDEERTELIALWNEKRARVWNRKTHHPNWGNDALWPSQEEKDYCKWFQDNFLNAGKAYEVVYDSPSSRAENVDKAIESIKAQLGWKIYHKNEILRYPEPPSYEKYEPYITETGEVIPDVYLRRRLFNCEEIEEEGMEFLLRQTRKGRLVAHTLAKNWVMPSYFGRYDAVDPRDPLCLTVAHVAAEFNTLPEGFDQWDLRDANGWTVAHVIAQYQRVLFAIGWEKFGVWELADNNGWTVRQEWDKQVKRMEDLKRQFLGEEVDDEG